MAQEQFRVKHQAFCEGYLHEKRNYPRPGLVVKEVQPGDVVTLVEAWNNFYGSYLRVEKDGVIYDLNSETLEIIK